MPVLDRRRDAGVLREDDSLTSRDGLKFHGSTVTGMDLSDLQRRLRTFADERDWNQFHTPKNLAMALTAEAGELLEIFQWLTPEEARDVMRDARTAESVRHELADVLAYLVRLADVLEVDLLSALSDKIEVNEVKYPVESARGRALKHDRLHEENT